MRAMRVKNIYTGIMVGVLSLASFGCEDNVDPLIEELQLSRVLSPVGVEARIRNRTTIELSWDTRDDADSYIVEFSEGNMDFSTIIRTVTVLPAEIPVQETFFGDTQYSARVKAANDEGVADSKWSAVTIRTDSEQIMEPVEDSDVQANEATLHWLAGSDVSHFIINPGNIERPISADEAEAGEATITELDELTEYSVVLYKGSSVRGSSMLKTLIDTSAPNTTLLTSTDDINAAISAASPGQRVVLSPGDYLAYSGSVVLDKSISIYGQYPYDKPLVHIQLSIESGATDIMVSNIDFNGDGTLNDFARFNSVDVAFGILTVDGCNIHDFSRSFIAGNVASTVAGVVVNNCIVTNVITGGGDLIDFRNTHVSDVKVMNSTFNNCAPGRDFIRMDAASAYTGTGLTSNVLIDHCTLYGVSNSQDRILYVRFDANVLTVQNTLIANTDGYYTNQNGSSQPTCSNNNYFNAAGFYTPAYVSNAKIDESSSYLTDDPGFVDAAIGDFTVTNQTLIDQQIGDPRWRP